MGKIAALFHKLILIPVSYTHLDVYKRQRLIPHLIINKNIVPKTTPTNHIKRNTLLYLELLEQGTSQYSCGNSKMYSFNFCFNSMTILHINPNSTMPVSYTHLDVYKRQILFQECNSHILTISGSWVNDENVAVAFLK